MKTFNFIKYGKQINFFVGQKVICTYYHEYKDEPNEYHKSFIKQLLDLPFKPVKFGIIVANAGIRPFWLGTNRKEQYLYVKFKEYFFKKANPMSCIEDAEEYADNNIKWLNECHHKIGKPGYDVASFNSLYNTANKAREFVNCD